MTAPDVSVRPMRTDELDAVTDLHRRSFPRYASTRLGAGYCRRMLRAYADRPESWVAVAVDGRARVVGYLVGAPPETQHAVDRSLVPWAALNAFRLPGDLARTLGRVTSGFGRRLRRREPEPTGAVAAAEPRPAATVRVVLVAVDGAARGGGVADALLTGFERTARDRGHLVADLSVAADNVAAHRAYLRSGWVADDDGTHFWRDLSGRVSP